MTFALVHASYSLPEWQTVKETFFAPCIGGTLESSTFGDRKPAEVMQYWS